MEIINTRILDGVAFEPDLALLIKRLRLKPGSAHEREFMHLFEEARAIAQPRAAYRAAYITGRGDDWVEIEGLRFTSRVLRVNLEKAHRVFAYLVTCGSELQAWSEQYHEMLAHFWTEEIKEMALRCAFPALLEDLRGLFNPGKTAAMSPGSLADWPVQEQSVLFDLLGPLAGAIGVGLTESMMMKPTKTVSGIYFPTEVDFESCQLCPRLECPGRRAPYDPHLFAERYSHRN